MSTDEKLSAITRRVSDDYDRHVGSGEDCDGDECETFVRLVRVCGMPGGVGGGEVTQDETLDAITARTLSTIEGKLSCVLLSFERDDASEAIRAALAEAVAMERARCAGLAEAARRHHDEFCNPVTEFAMRKLIGAIEEGEG